MTLCSVSIILSVIILCVVMLNVVAPPSWSFLTFVQTLAEDEDLRGETPADSVAESELNESFIFQADKNGRLSHKTKG